MIFGEDDEQNGGPQPGAGRPQIRLDTAQMETTYANFFAMAGAADEVTLYLGANSPLPGQAEPIMKVATRVIMTPPNAKRLMIALQQTVKAHEERFGPIELPPPPQQPRR